MPGRVKGRDAVNNNGARSVLSRSEKVRIHAYTIRIKLLVVDSDDHGQVSLLINKLRKFD